MSHTYDVEIGYTGDGTTTDYLIPFNFIDNESIHVKIDGTTRASSGFQINGTTLTLGSSLVTAADGKAIVIYRDTPIDKTKVVFQVGASIRAQDLNANDRQFLHAIQENESNAGTTADLAIGQKNHINVNTANNWLINDGVIDKDMLQNDIIDSSKLEDNSVNSEHYVDGSIDLVHLSANSVDSSKIVNDSIVNADINSNAAIEFTKLENLDSSKILVGNSSNKATEVSMSGDATISNSGVLTISADAVDSAEIVAGAIDTSHLSASGTKNTTTYLRGDNTWANLGNAVTGQYVWATWNHQSTLSLSGSNGVSSVTDQGTGHSRVNFTNDFTDVNYVSAGSNDGAHTNNGGDARLPGFTIQDVQVGRVDLHWWNMHTHVNESHHTDYVRCTAAFFR